MKALARSAAALLLATTALAGGGGVADVPSAVDVLAPPSAAVLPDGRILMASPVAGGVDVVACGQDGGFGQAIRAARHVGLEVGGRRGPRIAATAKVVVVAAITRHAKQGGGDLLAWTSTDEGRTWSDAVQVNDVAGAAQEGLFDLAAMRDGRVVCVWLDCRTKGMRLRADFSADGAKWGEDVLAYESPDGTICECCHPAIAAAPDGGAVVAFRNALKTDRDVWTVRLPRGAVKFEDAAKSGEGSWRIPMCPMAGPSVAFRGDEVVAAWRREKNVYLVVGGGKERDLGEGTEPQVLATKDGVHAFWTVKDALLHLAPGAAAPVEIARGASFPVAVAAPGGGLVLWHDAKAKRARFLLVR
jgi:hypothetical protein